MGTEFASAAMMRVLTRGLRELGLRPLPGETGHRAQAGATVDLDMKRALVQHAVAQGGLACLIQLGCGVHHQAHEPTHRAMVSAREPRELVVRWQRLERYIHSTHRIRIADEEPQGLVISHEGVRPGIVPSLHESLVVCGVLAALLEARGVQGLQIKAGRVRAYPSPAQGALEGLAVADPDRLWRFTWKACTAPQRHARAAESPEGLFATAAGAARHLELSLRSLQRELQARDLNFSGLVGECRARLAAMHLIESDLALAEIGFLCGYSDQAHFTREFGRRVGLAPQKYRLAFSERP